MPAERLQHQPLLRVELARLAEVQVEHPQRLVAEADRDRFKSDFGSSDFGDELDIGLTYLLLKGLTGKVEYADYRAGDAVPGDALANKVDVRKFWLTLIYQF